MKNWIFLWIVSSILLCIIPQEGSFVSAQIPRKKPHVILLIADDVGRNDLSYGGSNQIPTPNIDALAYNGVIFSNHYVLPLCTPSRTALLTGQYPLRLGMEGVPLSVAEKRAVPVNLTLLPEHLRDLGYSTHLIGKWHLGYYAYEFLPTNRGFDDFYGFYNGYMDYFDYTLPYPGTCHYGYDLHRDVGQNYTVDRTVKNVYATDLFAEEAENIIANHDPDVPMFLEFAMAAAHTSGDNAMLEVRDPKQVNETLGYITNAHRRLYAGIISAMDESVGRIVEALNKKGMLEDSVIIFMSDNGAETLGDRANEGSNFPYRGVKFDLYEGGVHVPSFIWSSELNNASSIFKDNFHITDWLPTIYKMAGGNTEDLGLIDGVDQWDAIREGTPGTRDYVLVNINNATGARAAIKDRFKYIKVLTDEEAAGKYSGENAWDGDISAPEYNITRVLQSTAALAIANATGNAALTPETISKLREASKVVCAPHTYNVADCIISHCLFDLIADPCETTDISDQYPELVRELDDFILSYADVYVPQFSPPLDPRALPLYENGPWLPWLTVEGELLPDRLEFANVTLSCFNY